jgi:hypothetical protein
LLGLVIAGMALLVAAYGFFAYSPAAAPGEKGPNALWAAHAWVGRAHAQKEYGALVDELRRHRISDVFFHVGPLSGDGAIPRRKYPNAADLIAEIKARAPAIRLHAWIGQVERRGGGPLDIADLATRARIVQTAADFVDLGFDGIHYNIEPIYSGDPNILALLEETAPVTRDRGKLLSLASDELSPFPGAEFLARLVVFRAGLWSADYYRAVAARVDQVAVMMYDTALPFDWLYGSAVAWETYRLVDLLGSTVTLFIGIPSYEDRRPGFDPEAENLTSALRGVKIALHHGTPPSWERFGVAVYARWTTDDAEWATYRRDWLGEREEITRRAPDRETASARSR